MLKPNFQLVEIVATQSDEKDVPVLAKKGKKKIESSVKRAPQALTKKILPSDNLLINGQSTNHFKGLVDKNKQKKVFKKRKSTSPIFSPLSSLEKQFNQISPSGRGQEHTGEGKKDLDREVKISYQVKPPYPSSARRDGIEGTVRLQVEILPNGRVGKVRVIHSSGSVVLDKSAADTVKNKYRFEAKTHNGIPVTSSVTFAVKFILEEESW